MRKIYLNLLLFLTLFFLADIVKADYEAVVVNPSGSKCSFSSKSTGFCFYKDSSLSTHYRDVYWLDTGDKVTVLSGHDSIKSKDPNLCSDYYVYTNFYYNAKPHYGYYCNAYLKADSLLTDELKKEFTDAGFPESYHEALAILKVAHPNWKFNAIDTKLTFKEAVDGENSLGKSLIQVTNNVNDVGYLNTWSGSYNYYTDTFKVFDGSNWYAANAETIAYYLDPRNFLKDEYIFQFETLGYNSEISDSKYISGINTMFSGDYLLKFSSNFLTAGKISLTNPIYLAALAKQEVGGYTTATTAIKGEYNGMYNFYNIGATSSTNPVINGLKYAAQTDDDYLLPWNTTDRAITGGAKWIASKYILIGQNTIYLKKWDLIPAGGYYNHQYQTNIQAASKEGNSTYISYNSINMLDTNFTFYIPVYKNMPASTSLPQKGNPNNYLKTLSINGVNVAEFDGAIENYNYNLDINNPKLILDATKVNNNAKIEGLGTFDIEDDCTKSIKVTAENGSVKTYNINVKLTGTELEDPIDVQTTLNNAGIKNGDKYLSGFTLGGDISIIKQKINNVRKDAIVLTYDSSGREKNSGMLSTGDKVTIKVGNDEKKYEIVIYGDINGDGKITPSDYAKAKNVFLKKATLSDSYLEAADVDKNGKITPSDYAKIKNAFLGKSTLIQ